MIEDEASDELIEWINKRNVNIRKLLKKLTFQEEMVVHAALDQARLFNLTTFYRVKTMSAKHTAERKRDLIKAKIGLLVRASGKKTTEAYIKERVEKNSRYQKALAAYHLAVEEETFARMLVDSFEMRMSAIKVVAQMSGYESVVEKRLKDRAAELGQTHERIRKKYHDDDSDDPS